MMLRPSTLQKSIIRLLIACVWGFGLNCSAQDASTEIDRIAAEIAHLFNPDSGPVEKQTQAATRLQVSSPPPNECHLPDRLFGTWWKLETPVPGKVVYFGLTNGCKVIPLFAMKAHPLVDLMNKDGQLEARIDDEDYVFMIEAASKDSHESIAVKFSGESHALINIRRQDLPIAFR